MSVRRKLAAILFADIVGFSSQVSFDETTGLEQRRRVEQLIKASAGSHNARVVKTIGDAVMLEFVSAVEAVSCALDIQKAMQVLNEEMAPLEPVQVRIGVHVGDVVEEDGDLYGNAVNIAKRVEEVAPSGGICITREVYIQIRPVLQVQCVPVTPESLQKLPELVEVFEVRTEEEVSVVRAPRERTKSSTLAMVFGLFRELLIGRGKGQKQVAEEEGEERMTLSRAKQFTMGRWFLERLKEIGRALGLLALGAVLFSVSAWFRQWGHWYAVAIALKIAGVIFSLKGGISFLISLFGLLAGYAKHAYLDGKILKKCKEVGSVPEAIVEPLSRALSAYVGIHQMGNESAWKRIKIRVNKYVQQARAQLIALLERGQQLGGVAAMLERFEDEQAAPVHYQKTAELYQRQCAQLVAAAGVFEQAEAKMSRVLLAAADKAQPFSALEESRREMATMFDALTNALEYLQEIPALPTPGPGERTA